MLSPKRKGQIYDAIRSELVDLRIELNRRKEITNKADFELAQVEYRIYNKVMAIFEPKVSTK